MSRWFESTQHHERPFQIVETVFCFLEGQFAVDAFIVEDQGGLSALRYISTPASHATVGEDTAVAGWDAPAIQAARDAGERPD